MITEHIPAPQTVGEETNCILCTVKGAHQVQGWSAGACYCPTCLNMYKRLGYHERKEPKRMDKRNENIKT